MREKKRTELHVHTTYTCAEGEHGLITPEELIRWAIENDLKAIAVTDINCVQAFPGIMRAADAAKAAGHSVKVIYGMELLVEEEEFEYNVLCYAKNREGLKNLYLLTALLSPVERSVRDERVRRSDLEENREGLIQGMPYMTGEYHRKLFGNGKLSKESADLYDFFEVQPHAANLSVLELYAGAYANEVLEDEDREYLDLAKEFEKPVIAASDANYAAVEDMVLCHILKKDKRDFCRLKSRHLRTAGELQEELAFLGEETAQAVIFDNPDWLADQVEEIRPVPDKTIYPKSGERLSIMDLMKRVYEKAKGIYGDPMPSIVEERLAGEWNAILENGYGGVFCCTVELADDLGLAEENPVRTESAGGASFVAMMTGITAVNPLPPHYVCPKCKHSDFDHGERVDSGLDLPEKQCPVCGEVYVREGWNLPFEVFMGPKGDREPEFILSTTQSGYERIESKKPFDGINTTRANEVRFYETFIKRRIEEYLSETGEVLNEIEMKTLVEKGARVKESDALHRSSMFLIPKNADILEFTPMQFSREEASFFVTHFDHKDVKLGRIDFYVDQSVTMLALPEGRPAFDNRYGIVLPSEVKTLAKGLPLLGRPRVREVMDKMEPQSYSDLVRILGVALGDGTWENNGDHLYTKVWLKGLITCMEDIYLYLISKGMDSKPAYQIMSDISAGKGLSEQQKQLMQSHDVPDWYIESCGKIGRLYSKGGLAAHVVDDCRLAAWKKADPGRFYRAYFQTAVLFSEFEAALEGGESSVRAYVNELEELKKSKGELRYMHRASLEDALVALEMFEAGFGL